MLITACEYQFSKMVSFRLQIETPFIQMVFGYLYPAFECFKLVEKQDLQMDQLKFLCHYWLPLYNEVKVALILYLWHPRTRGTILIYVSFVRPYMVNHEKKIDLFFMDLSKKIGTITTLLWQKALSYSRQNFFEFTYYIPV
ncbi:hypothetical protein C2S52_018210 [Perilla frutescens var. hirtella]|nr:hypothetical protein C2S52_018210 [Perilla frutescens var. hirtella]